MAPRWQKKLWPSNGQKYLWPTQGQKYLWPTHGQKYSWPSQMVKNIYDPHMAKNIYGPPMAKNSFSSHYYQYLCSIQGEKGQQTKFLENADKTTTTTKVKPRSASLTLCSHLKSMLYNIYLPLLEQFMIASLLCIFAIAPYKIGHRIETTMLFFVSGSSRQQHGLELLKTLCIHRTSTAPKSL